MMHWTPKDILMAMRQFLDNNSFFDSQLHRSYWDDKSLFWKYGTMPNRPSSGDIQRYRYFLDHAKRYNKILLLGSTPELRDLLAERYDTSKIFLMDSSFPMILAMTRETKRVNPKKEIWIKSLWEEPNLPSEFFDIVIGDLVLQQFPPYKEEKFLQQISNFLVPHGTFIMRCRILDEDIRKMLFNEVAAEVIRNSNHADVECMAATLFWKVYDAFSNLKTREIDLKKAINTLKNIQKNYLQHPAIDCALNKLQTSRKRFPFQWRWASPNRDTLTHMLSKYFLIRNKNTSDDYMDAKLYPIFFLEKKS